MTKNLIILILAVMIIFAGPWATIVSINTLFGTAIPVNISTWFASLWLGMLVGGGVKAASK